MCDVNRCHTYQDNVLQGKMFVDLMNLRKSSLHTLEQERYSFYDDLGIQFHRFYCRSPMHPSWTSLHALW